MTARTSFELGFGPADGERRRKTGELPQVLVLGDFSGRSGGREGFAAKRVRFDTIDAVLKGLAARIPVHLEGPVSVDETLALTAIDDLHPDNLLRQMDVLRTLTELGRRLNDPNTRPDAEKALGELVSAPPAEASTEPAKIDGPETESNTDTLERLLGQAKGSGSPAKDKVQSFIDQVMASSGSATAASAESSSHQQLEELRTAVLRAVLSLPAFRSTERRWLSLDWLVRRVDDDLAKIWICDASLEALATEIAEQSEHLNRSPLHKLLNAPESVNRWDAVVWDEQIGLDVGQLAVLATLGAVCGQAGVPLFAGASLALAGCHSLADIDAPWDWQVPDGDAAAFWQELRAHPAASAIGLVAPRVLVRPPYGEAGNPIDTFDFEELGPGPAHEQFSWGNAAYHAAVALVQRLSGAGDDVLIGDLPTALYDDGTGQAMQPPAEAIINESALGKLTECGIAAIIGARNQDSVRLSSLGAIARTE